LFSLEFLSEIRHWEAERIVRYFPPGARILDIGAGTGQQALEFSQQGFEVEAIDVSDSLYSEVHVFPVKEYDGVTIPFADRSFDIVFSSSVLEHVDDLSRLHSEVRRVLKDDGYAVHVLPTHVWRIWTSITEFHVAIDYCHALDLRLHRPITRQELYRFQTAWRMAARRFARAAFRQRRHGSRGNVLTELRSFNPKSWRKNFKTNGFRIEQDLPLGLFYTGYLALGPKLKLSTRAKFARYLGSACHLFVLRKS
jgi:ubiquinone/menaquinone biosynthesis C-methylase UbiE